MRGFGFSKTFKRGSVGAVAAPKVPPVNTVLPVISNEPIQGGTLNVDTGTWTNAPTGYTYQWRADAVAIALATASTLAVTAGMVGKMIDCIVTAANADGPGTAIATAIGPVTAAVGKPVNTVAPSISGTAQVGATLTINPGAWNPAASSYQYAWFWTDGGANAGSIAGQTGANLDITADLVGKYVYATVRGVNAAGASDAAGFTADFGPIASASSTAPNAPALAFPTGYAAGSNPPSWESQYTGVIWGRDTIELNWRVNGGAWQSEFHLVTSDDAILGEWDWPGFAAAVFSGGATVDIRERHIRDRGEPTEAASPYSNVISDTMAVSAWSPASLFGSEYGFILDPSNAATMFQDTAGVTPAAVDQPVGRINDLSPRGNNFSQATAGARPIRKNVGGRAYLEFDGVDDLLKLATAGMYNAGSATIIMAMQNVDTANLGVLLGERGSASSQPLYYPFTETSAAGNRRLFIVADGNVSIKNSPSTSVSPFDGNWNLSVIEDIGTSVIVERTTAAGAVANNGAGTTYVRTGTATLNRTGLGGTTSTTDGNWTNVRVGRMFVIGRLLTAAEKTLVKNWVATTSGITMP